MDRFKAGIIQFDVRLGQIDANVESVVTGISELAEAGADIAVLPEMWSCGFDHENLKIHAARTPEILALLERLARENHMAIAGSLPAMNGQAVTNTLYLIDSDGTLRSGYSKIHLFSPGSEHLHFAAGDKTAICDLELGKTGLMTCYDIRFPELGRNLALQGAEILIVSAQWPLSREAHWDVLLKARAIENQVFVLAANRCGNDPHQEYAGHSMILSPWGEVLGMAERAECFVTAELTMADVARARDAIPCFADRRPAVYADKMKDVIHD